MSQHFIKYLKYNFFLVLAISSLLISVVVKFFFVENKAYKTYTEEVAEKVRNEIALTEEIAAETAKEALKSDFYERVYEKNFKHTCIIFNSGNPVFWSDNHFFVNFEN